MLGLETSHLNLMMEIYDVNWFLLSPLSPVQWLHFLLLKKKNKKELI